MQYGTAIILSSAGLLGAKIIEANLSSKLGIVEMGKPFMEVKP